MGFTKTKKCTNKKSIMKSILNINNTHININTKITKNIQNNPILNTFNNKTKTTSPSNPTLNNNLNSNSILSSSLLIWKPNR